MSRFETIGNTKIICTIGPSTNSVDRLCELIDAGMDVARLNFSHGSRQEHRSWIERIREAALKRGESIAVLQDLSGPKIRTGTVAGGAVEIKEGQRFTFTIDEIEGTATKVSTTYKSLPRDVRKGDTILVDDGKMKFRVESSDATNVVCFTINGGVLHDKKGMNLPGVRVSAPSLTEKDLEDLEFGLKNGIDYIALSFVRTADDLLMLRDLIAKKGSRSIPIVAKVERAEAVEHFEDILKVADVIMVARGDLGVELAPEEVPIIQKHIVRRCNATGVPVIIATQMLESMIEQPRPTRAEANDVANAVLDGADAVMLSGETSVGRYPVEAVRTMDQIIRRSEANARDRAETLVMTSDTNQRVFDAIARAACVLGREVQARAIIAITHSGATARAISKYRPVSRIVAVTDQEEVLRRLNLVWGVRGMLVKGIVSDTDTSFSKIKKELKGSEFVHEGDYVVFTAGIPLMSRGTTNTIKVEKVE